MYLGRGSIEDLVLGQLAQHDPDLDNMILQQLKPISRGADINERVLNQLASARGLNGYGVNFLGPSNPSGDTESSPWRLDPVDVPDEDIQRRLDRFFEWINQGQPQPPIRDIRGLNPEFWENLTVPNWWWNLTG